MNPRKRKRGRKKSKQDPTLTTFSSQPSPLPSPDLPLSQPQKTHAQIGKQKRRARQRREARAATLAHLMPMPKYNTRPSASLRNRSIRVLNTSINAFNLRHAKGGYIGLRQPVGQRFLTVDQALADGFQYVRWDGMYVHLSTF